MRKPAILAAILFALMIGPAFALGETPREGDRLRSATPRSVLPLEAEGHLTIGRSVATGHWEDPVIPHRVPTFLIPGGVPLLAPLYDGKLQ
jgi:hypothetical protein